MEPFALCEVSTGWSLHIDGCPWTTFHFVLRGNGRLRDPNGLVELGPSTLVLVPPGVPHDLDRGVRGDHESVGPSDIRSGDGLIEFIAGDDGDRELYVMCGRLNATYGDAGPGIFSLLDHSLVIDFSDNSDVVRTFDLIMSEQQHPSAGSKAMTNTLMTASIVHVFRRLLSDDSIDLAWLDVLADQRMVAAVEAILDHPEAPHTVDSLAGLAMMSRSAFHAQFSVQFGRTPGAFVRDVRLRRAAELFTTTDQSVDSVMSRVGFASRSQFSNAFKDFFGLTPAQFRSSGPTVAIGVT